MKCPADLIRSLELLPRVTTRRPFPPPALSNMFCHKISFFASKFLINDAFLTLPVVFFLFMGFFYIFSFSSFFF